ncbi:DNA repair protein RadA [Caulifigura coniformis]|uniref:DNA repair protein RadA n=1 Tax=Caulifigura coniformis TaxID=2527983 RepID=A0A517SMQ4_9PLAN|nr:AAA family ATPase [Caulifigura coniformis]QDT57409.1 DNA repair protein RadA [Caulifigura coniformis]
MTTKPTKPAKTKQKPGPKPAKRPEPTLIPLAGRRQKPITWLWHDRLPLGKVSLLVGEPGAGKSFLCLDLAARISRGVDIAPEPTLPNPAGVLLLSADDNVDDTILPRLEAAGADLNRITLLSSFAPPLRDGRPHRLLSLARDFDQLEQALDKLPDCRLIIIDPINAYLAAVSSNSHTAVRRLMDRLARLAATKNAAILLVSHPRKQAGPSAIYRPLGSLAFAAVARVVLMLTNDPTVANRRLLLPVKVTWNAAPTGRAFRIEDGRIAWEPAPIPFTADDASILALTDDRTSDPRRNAKNWLIEQLKEKRQLAEEIHHRARAAGIPVRLLWQAKKDCKVRAVLDGREKRWYWKLPDMWLRDFSDDLLQVI